MNEFFPPNLQMLVLLQVNQKFSLSLSMKKIISLLETECKRTAIIQVKHICQYQVLIKVKLCKVPLITTFSPCSTLTVAVSYK